MAIKKYALENKPLCIAVYGDTAYIGDTGGQIVSCAHPFSHPALFSFRRTSPVSCLCFDNGVLFYANWDGEVTRVDLRTREVAWVELESGMAKCCKCFGGNVFVSVNLRVYVLSPDLEILRVHEMRSKVLCMEAFNAEIYCGMSVPYIAVLGKDEVLSKHCTSILGMCVSHNQLLTASADNTIRGSGDEVVFEGKKWIRAIGNGVFSEGERVWASNGVPKCIYSHRADVSGVATHNDCILSVGFDHMLCVFNAEEAAHSDEEREIAALLAETRA